MTKAKRIGVIDSETDPFKHGAVIKPFCFGFYNGDVYKAFWGDDCVEQLYSYLESLTEPHIIYAHNGGKFDFFFLLQKGMLENPALIINGRIVKAGLMQHELRDSYAIMPMALKAYNKEETDYSTFTREKRERYKEPILKYLKSDCVYLYELCDAFVKRFTPKLTIGSTAISELGKLHPVIRLNKEHDTIFRPYYFGGRVECFEYGKLKGAFKVFDVNSMYPDVMRNEVHPIGSKYISVSGEAATKIFDKSTGKLKGFTGMYFIHFTGRHRGCLPTRLKNGLSFESASGEYFTTSHEMIAGIEMGLIDVQWVNQLHIPSSFTKFDKYVDKFIIEKIDGKKTGDKIKEIFAKFLLNSAYGKFATNPENFKEWFFVDASDPESVADFETWRYGKGAELSQDFGRFEIWTAPVEIKENSFFDVATAASITGAARAKIMRAIAKADRPIYCDTDSIICQDLTGVEIHSSDLGAWKLEEECDTLYIAGKKLYACMRDGEAVKTASKGAKLDAKEIAMLCTGQTVTWKSEAPNFKFSGETKYVERKISKRY